MINLVGARAGAKKSLLIVISGFCLCFLIAILAPTSQLESTTLTSRHPRYMLTLSTGLYSYPPIIVVF
jgi:hypothetical protein